MTPTKKSRRRRVRCIKAWAVIKNGKICRPPAVVDSYTEHTFAIAPTKKEAHKAWTLFKGERFAPVTIHIESKRERGGRKT